MPRRFLNLLKDFNSRQKLMRGDFGVLVKVFELGSQINEIFRVG